MDFLKVNSLIFKRYCYEEEKIKLQTESTYLWNVSDKKPHLKYINNWIRRHI